jgi:hypothetical protein
MTTRRLPALVAALLALATLLPSAAGAQTTTLTPRQELINFGIGCPPDTAGTCSSTTYFLSKDAGDNSVASVGAFTPLFWAERRALGGDFAINTFAADKTLAPSYLLQGGGELAGVISVGGYLTGAELAADSTVYVRITAHVVGQPTSSRVTLLEATINKAVVAAGDTEYAFSTTLPATLDRVRVDGLRAEVGHDSATVLGNGFMDGRGGSNFLLPFYRESL